MRSTWWITFLLSLLIAGTVTAQQCPPLVEETLLEVSDSCADAARNELCYGSRNLQAELLSGNVSFEQPGDIISVDDVLSLQLSDAESGDWGVALLRVQANLPDTLPGQNVNVLLFGDVELIADGSASQAFYFRGGVGAAGCDEAPSGMLLQSPAGETVEMTINGANIEFGSTVLVQPSDLGMEVSTLSGVATLEAQGSSQIIVQGSVSELLLDENNQPAAAPIPAEPLDAAALLPFAEVLNKSQIIVPTYEDAAASPRIQQLVADGILPELNADAPLIQLTQEQVDAARAALVPSGIQIQSGLWRIAEQNYVSEGTCLDPNAGGADGGGDPDYRMAICGTEDNSALYFSSNPTPLLAENLYGSGYQYEQPVFGTDEIILVSLDYQYRVVSPERIEFTFTSVEQNGCTITYTAVYELAEAQEDACVIEEVEDSGTSAPVEFLTVEPGTYTSTDVYTTGCEATFGETFATATFTASDPAMLLSFGENEYSLDFFNGLYMVVEGTTSIAAMSMEPGVVSVTWTDGVCTAFGSFRPAE